MATSSSCALVVSLLAGVVVSTSMSAVSIVVADSASTWDGARVVRGPETKERN